jgi:Protein of unknown function (DUF3995)
VDFAAALRSCWQAVAAAAWCIAFAGVHLFWALGGSVGLASSAGHDLAARRPATFVLFGLYGVALALLCSVAVLAFASTTRPSARRRRAATTLVGVVGIGLLLRGAVFEVLLGWDTGGLANRVGPLETQWSLILWNPWFTVGGALFLASAIRLRRAAERARPSP